MSNKCFAVLDVETNWDDQVMSVGVVIADCGQFAPVKKLYCIISPECQVGGYYSHALKNVDDNLTRVCSRAEAISTVVDALQQYDAESICAYNARFDYSHLPELHHYRWHDIMYVAGNIKFNHKLPADEDYFSTGLLKRKSFERVMRLVYWKGYTESHNALCDAIDELQLMQIINQRLEVYPEYKPSSASSPNTSARKQQKDLLRAEQNLKWHKYVIEELCGGAIRLISVDERKRIEKAGSTTSISYQYTLHLECARCGYQWTQDRDSFFDKHLCPNCHQK